MRTHLIRVAGFILVVVLGLLLWRWSAPSDESRGLHGGPMFSFSADRVDRLEVRRPRGHHVLVRDRADGGWRLEGDTPDLVDATAMNGALESLVAAGTFPVLPGTEPDERRFGFGGEHSIELIFHLQGGARHRVALGDVAPVSDQVYASGAGRPGVFGVGGGFYSIAARLPDSARLMTLLPVLTLDEASALALERRGAPTLYFRQDETGVWWLRGDVQLTGLAARYHEHFADRRSDQAGSRWWRANERRLANLVFRATATSLAGFVPPLEATPGLMAEHGLDDPYRGIVLHAADEAHRLELGEEQSQKLVMARRDGALVLTRAEALGPAEGPLSDYLDLSALGFRLLDADSLHVDEGAEPLLWGVRAADVQARFAARQSPWDVSVPPGREPMRDHETIANQVHDLQVYLDRLAMVDLLPDAQELPLSRDGVWRVTAWSGKDEPRRVWLGRHRVSGRPALWDRATGRVAVVDEEILVSLRSLRGAWN